MDRVGNTLKKRDPYIYEKNHLNIMCDWKSFVRNMWKNVRRKKKKTPHTCDVMLCHCVDVKMYRVKNYTEKERKWLRKME